MKPNNPSETATKEENLQKTVGVQQAHNGISRNAASVFNGLWLWDILNLSRGKALDEITFFASIQVIFEFT